MVLLRAALRASSDESIATISANGTIHPLKAGEVEFWLEAVNGGLEEYQGEKYSPTAFALTIQEGANPYLTSRRVRITLCSGDPLTLRWASNLAQKNSEFGDAASTLPSMSLEGRTPPEHR